MPTGVSLFVWLPDQRARCRMVVHRRCRLRPTIQRAQRGDVERAQLRAQWDPGPRRCHESGKSAPLLIIRFDHDVVANHHRDITVLHREVARLQRAGQGFTVTSHLGGRSPRGDEPRCSRAGEPPILGGAQNRNRSGGSRR
jgi:hypothetical protein